jgi:hydrogenase maturation protease
MLVIGCGNPDRGDDGAGTLVAQQLRQCGVDACVYAGETLGLLDLWEHADEVILVDAVVTGAPAGSIHVWDARRTSLPAKTPDSTHWLGVAEAIELARSLNRLPCRLEVYGIEGHCFDLGTGVSLEIQHAADKVVRRILTRIAHQADRRFAGMNTRAPASSAPTADVRPSSNNSFRVS